MTDRRRGPHWSCNHRVRRLRERVQELEAALAEARERLADFDSFRVRFNRALRGPDAGLLGKWLHFHGLDEIVMRWDEPTDPPRANLTCPECGRDGFRSEASLARHRSGCTSGTRRDALEG